MDDQRQEQNARCEETHCHSSEKQEECPSSLRGLHQGSFRALPSMEVLLANRWVEYGYQDDHHKKEEKTQARQKKKHLFPPGPHEFLLPGARAGREGVPILAGDATGEKRSLQLTAHRGRDSYEEVSSRAFFSEYCLDAREKGGRLSEGKASWPS